MKRRRAIAVIVALAFMTSAWLAITLAAIVWRDARRLDALQTELEHEFARTVDIVQRREHTAYENDSPLKRGWEVLAEIERLLERRRRLRLDCSVYEARLEIVLDMRTYDHWIEADRRVRLAKRKFAQGDVDGARHLLHEVLGLDPLGPDARASVERRLATWRTRIDGR